MTQDKSKDKKDTKQQKPDIDLMTDKEKQNADQKEMKSQNEPVRGGKGPHSPGDEDDQGDR